MTETIPLTPQTGKSDAPETVGSRLPLRLIDLILMVALAVGALMAFRLLLHPREVTTGTVIALLIGQNAVLLAIIWLVAIVYRGASLRATGLRARLGVLVPPGRARGDLPSDRRHPDQRADFDRLGKAVRKPADPADHAGPEGLGRHDRDVHRDRHRGAGGGGADAPQRPLWLAAEAPVSGDRGHHQRRRLRGASRQPCASARHVPCRADAGMDL